MLDIAKQRLIMTDVAKQLLYPEGMPTVEHRDFFLGAGYQLNQYGYRCDEFDAKGDFKLVSIGCSNTFGWCVAEEDRFSEVFLEKIKESTGKNVVNWNIGYPAKSNDYISRMTIIALHLLKPDLLLTCFTDIGRREYFGIEYPEMGCFNYIPAEYPKNVKKHIPHFMPYAHRFNGLTSPLDDLMNAYKNIKLVETTALATKTPWLFATFCEEETNFILENYPQQHVGGFPDTDKAADGMHPGPISHRELADKFFRRYKDVYLDKIPMV
jgi:hypothetical protein